MCAHTLERSFQLSAKSETAIIVIQLLHARARVNNNRKRKRIVCFVQDSAQVDCHDFVLRSNFRIFTILRTIQFVLVVVF